MLEVQRGDDPLVLRLSGTKYLRMSQIKFVEDSL